MLAHTNNGDQVTPSAWQGAEIYFVAYCGFHSARTAARFVGCMPADQNISAVVVNVALLRSAGIFAHFDRPGSPLPDNTCGGAADAAAEGFIEGHAAKLPLVVLAVPGHPVLRGPAEIIVIPHQPPEQRDLATLAARRSASIFLATPCRARPR